MYPKLREFEESDLPEISKIESSSFSDAWPDSFFSYCHRKAPELFVVGEDKEGIVGYVVGEMREAMFSGRSYMSKMGHILNIAVDPRRREGGIGSLLMDKIEARFKEADATIVTLEVRESNDTARTFYMNRGFNEIGRVRAYYPGEDAIVMNKAL